MDLVTAWVETSGMSHWLQLGSSAFHAEIEFSCFSAVW